MILRCCLLAAAFALQHTASSQKCDGQPTFFTQRITGREAATIRPFVTKPGVPSLHCCARLCASLEFCVTALFDSLKSSCGISYAAPRAACHRPFLQTTTNEEFAAMDGLFAVFCAKCSSNGPLIGQRCDGPKVTSTPSQTYSTRAPYYTTQRPNQASSTTGEPSTTTRAYYRPSRPYSRASPATYPTTSQSRSPPTVSITMDSRLPSSPVASTTSQSAYSATSPPYVTSTTSAAPIVVSTSSRPDLLGVVESSKSDSCFVEYPRQVLVGQDEKVPATFVIETGLTLGECKCYCAASWLSNRYSRQCESFQYYPDRAECFLNDRDDRSRRYALANLVADKGSHFRFPCHRTELHITQFILHNCRGLLPPPNPEAEFQAPASVFAQSGRHMCFDVQRGYVLAGQSREIHHDVSMQQCMCACAGAKAFRCLAALYYAKERECTLTLRNRVQRPDMFRRDESSYDVVYLGLTCARDRDRSRFLDIHCPATVFPKGAPKTTRSDSLIVGGLGECFAEELGWTLRGAPEALVSGVSLEACQCHCLFSSLLRDFPCHSVQFDWDSGACQLSRHSPGDQPRRFVRLRGDLHHRHFGRRCPGLARPPQLLKPELLASPPLTYAAQRCQQLRDFDLFGLSIAAAPALPTSNRGPLPRPPASSALPTDGGVVRLADPDRRRRHYSFRIPYRPAKPRGGLVPVSVVALPRNDVPIELDDDSRAQTLRISPDARIPSGRQPTSQLSLQSELRPTPVYSQPLTIRSSRRTSSAVPTISASSDQNTTEWKKDEEQRIPKDQPPPIPTLDTSVRASAKSPPSSKPPNSPKATTSAGPTASSRPTTTTARPFVPISQSSFPTLGRCAYSLEREKQFKSSLILDRVIVTDALSCVKLCSSLADCRSANFLAFEVSLYYCELMRDTPLDYSFYELRSAVAINPYSAFFYGVSCERLPRPGSPSRFAKSRKTKNS